ncbi:hypothetical protein ACGFY3_29830 [Streptomyces mirabilis]|uniref:hypothetical protein n=1 Tax=Streptomyces mirabilis TaxID=68239 RepID=UPI0037221860
MAVSIGMLPVAAPTIYHVFPTWAQIIDGRAITSAALAAFLLNRLFNHTSGRKKTPTETENKAVESAVSDAAPAI